MYLDTNDPQTNHFWPSFRSGFPKNGVYKENRLIFWPILSVFLHRRDFLTYIPISARRSFSLLTHSHSSLIYCYCYYQTFIKKVPSSCRPLRLYLSSTQASDPIHTEPYYQTFRTHITPIRTFFVLRLPHPSSSPSARLFFFMFCGRLTPFTLRKPRVLRWQPPLLPPAYKLVILFNVIVNLTLTSLIPGSHHCEYMFRYLFSPRCFSGDYRVDLGEVDHHLVHIPPLISFFSLACSTAWQWLFEKSKWFGKIFLASDSRVLLPPPVFKFVRDLCFLSC